MSAGAACAAEVPILELSEADARALSEPGAVDPHAAVLPVTATVPPAVTVTTQAAPLPVPEASNWAMLAIGAGVLLLPRRRRPDNSVR